MNKKEKIKNRIDLINRDEIPKGYKKEHGFVIPTDWKYNPLKIMCKIREDKAGEEKLETLSISAGIGFVNQAEKFGRELSGKQYINYTVIKKGDFSYNKGNSKKYPQGCIYLLEDRDIAAVPNAFNTFTLNDDYNKVYYKQLFSIGFLNKQLYRYINWGVRNDGLLNLYNNDFYNSILPVPSNKEQEKIAEILSCCDKVIELKQKLIDEKQKQKRYLMQNLFDKITNYKKLSDIALIIMGQSPNSKKYNSIQRGIPLIQGNADCKLRQTCPKLYTTEITKKCLINDIIMSVRAPVGAISKSVHNACIGRGVCAIRPFQNSNYVYQYLLHIENKWNKLIQGSTFESINSNDIKNTLIPYPDCKTQQRIERILSQADKEIKLLEQELEQYKQLKKSLSQLLLTGIVRVNEV